MLSSIWLLPHTDKRTECSKTFQFFFLRKAQILYFFKCEISGFLHLTILKENTDVSQIQCTDWIQSMGLPLVTFIPDSLGNADNIFLSL